MAFLVLHAETINNKKYGILEFKSLTSLEYYAGIYFDDHPRGNEVNL